MDAAVERWNRRAMCWNADRFKIREFRSITSSACGTEEYGTSAVTSAPSGGEDGVHDGLCRDDGRHRRPERRVKTDGSSPRRFVIVAAGLALVVVATAVVSWPTRQAPSWRPTAGRRQSRCSTRASCRTTLTPPQGVAGRVRAGRGQPLLRGPRRRRSRPASDRGHPAVSRAGQEGGAGKLSRGSRPCAARSSLEGVLRVTRALAAVEDLGTVARGLRIVEALAADPSARAQHCREASTDFETGKTLHGRS